MDKNMTLSDLMVALANEYNAQTGAHLGFFDNVVYLDIDGIKTPLQCLEIDLKGGVGLYGKEV